MTSTIPSIAQQIFDNVLSLSLSITQGAGPGPVIPLDVILFNGIPLTYNGEFLIYN